MSKAITDDELEEKIYSICLLSGSGAASVNAKEIMQLIQARDEQREIDIRRDERRMWLKEYEGQPLEMYRMMQQETGDEA